MKVLDQGGVFHARGIENAMEYEFSQTQAAKLMDMFSNNLYSDKVRAPIRELSTNAWDSHVSAGNTEQVPEIHLPNHKDAEFRIRDYGTGLSPEAIEQIYRKYGESNKIHSNDFNGCMGIGSKSPFAYTRSFATTSYYNGVKYVYVNAKNQHNMPTLNLMHKEETDEPNGLEVSFAVERKDFHAFENAADEVLRWFPKPFNVNGGFRYETADYRIPSRQYALEGSKWKIRSDTNTSCAIMGYVEYPIEAKHFTKDNTQRTNDWYQWYDNTPHVKLLNLGLELHFDIGEVEMDISRERLQYTPQTIDIIKARLDKVLDEIKAEISQKFKDAKTLWEARVLYNELYNGDLRGVRNLIDIVGTEWNGHEINGNINISSLPDGLDIRQFGNRAGGTKRTDIPYRINANKHVVFYENDMKRGSYVASQRVIENSDQIRVVYLLKFKDNKERQEFCDIVGISPSDIKKTSSVPKPPKGKRKKNYKIFTFTTDHFTRPMYGYHLQPRYWDKQDVDFDKGGLYVELNNWKVITTEGKKSGGTLHDIFNALETLGIRRPRIVGVKTAVVDKYRKAKQWNDFFDWAEKKINDRIKLQNLEQIFEDIQKIRKYSGNSYRYTVDVCGIVDNSNTNINDPDCSIMKLYNRLTELQDLQNRWQNKIAAITEAYRHVCRSSKFTSSKSDTELKDMYNTVLSDYPFITLLSRWDHHDSEKCTIVCDTVNLANSCKGE